MLGTDSRKPPTQRSRSNHPFVTDSRAIEGLPIRLVIALIVGVVSLGIMLQILGGIGTFETDTEVDVEFEGDVLDINADEHRGDFSILVFDEDGNEVTDATVIATAGSAQMDGAIVETTGSDSNEAKFTFSDENLRLPPDQNTGTIQFEVQPPSGTNWVDEKPNNELLVVD